MRSELIAGKPEVEEREPHSDTIVVTACGEHVLEEPRRSLASTHRAKRRLSIRAVSKTAGSSRARGFESHPAAH